MGVTKTTISEGSGPSPNKGDQVTMQYTGWLKNADGSKGKQFDSTTGRGPFKTAIGVGQVIRGTWGSCPMASRNASLES
jgi:FK506-binding protein 1